MGLFNKIITDIFDILFFPFRFLHPIWGLLFISVLTGIIMLLIFKYTSDQTGIEKTKNRIKAHILEIRLYKNDGFLSLIAIKDIMTQNFKYLSFAVKPMLFLVPPMLIILTQLAIRFEYQPLSIGKSTIITLNHSFENPPPNITLQVPEFIKCETPRLDIPSKNQCCWRIRAEKKGKDYIIISMADQTVTKELMVGSGFFKVIPKRVKTNSLGALIHPGETLLPKNSRINNISVLYPQSDLFGIHWLVVFLVVSLITGFSLKSVFNVNI